MRIELEKRGTSWHISVLDGDRVVITAAGDTPREAGRWAKYHLDRVHSKGVDALIEIRLIENSD